MTKDKFITKRLYDVLNTIAYGPIGAAEDGDEAILAKIAEMARTAIAGIHLTELLATDRAREQVNHPQHYGGDTPYEVIKVLKAWLPREQYIGFLRGSALKYDARLGKKGEPVEDAKKSQWYQNELVKELESGD